VEVGHVKAKSRIEKSGIIVAAAMRSLEIRIAAMPDESPTSVEAFVRANMKCGETLLTSGHKSYLGLSDYYHADPQRVGEKLQLPITFSLHVAIVGGAATPSVLSHGATQRPAPG
jgi:hypothetical protein